MTATIPDSVDAQGNIKVMFVPTLADPSAPTTTELQQGTDISCYMLPGWTGPSVDEATGEVGRFCTTQRFTRRGHKTWSFAPLQYTYLPQQIGQGGGGGTGNKVYTALAEGTQGFLVLGYGIDPEVDFATGDIVDTYPIECGTQMKPTESEDEFTPLVVNQNIYVTGTVQQDAAIAA